MSITINKAHIKKKMFLSVEYSERRDDGTTDKVKKSCEQVTHTDLRNAFAQLKTILAEACEQFRDSGELEEGLYVSGFTITGDSEGEGVVITGSRDLLSGKNLNLNSPLLEWEDAEGLFELIKICKREVYEYLFEGKHEPSPQKELFDSTGEPIDEDEEEETDY